MWNDCAMCMLFFLAIPAYADQVLANDIVEVGYLAIPTDADQILENDIVEVGCFHPTDVDCTGTEGMRMAFDLCCPCFRWSFEGDVSSTKQGTYTLGVDEIGWVSHITNENCDPAGRTANKVAGNPTCIQQPEGRAYRCKIQAVNHRNQSCDQLAPVCEQGPFPTDPYVPLEGGAFGRELSFVSLAGVVGLVARL